FGIGGAILGLILYSVVGIVTGLEIGYVSLAVGYLVGQAIKMGSGGMGGRRYQIAALALTYAAVSVSAVPIALSQMSKHASAAKSNQTTPGPAVETDETEVKETAPEEDSPMGLGAAFAYLALLGLASPFLDLADPLHGLIGLVILFVGMQIAWKMT